MTGLDSGCDFHIKRTIRQQISAFRAPDSLPSFALYGGGNGEAKQQRSGSGDTKPLN
jgi:hypothetical protein